MMIISNLVTISIDCQHVHNNIAILVTVNTTNLVTISTAIFFHHVCHTIVRQTINTTTNTSMMTSRLCWTRLLWATRRWRSGRTASPSTPTRLPHSAGLCLSYLYSWLISNLQLLRGDAVRDVQAGPKVWILWSKLPQTMCLQNPQRLFWKIEKKGDSSSLYYDT